MPSPARKLAAPPAPTFEELYAQIEALPEGVTGEILEPGVLHTMSRPARPHRFTAKRCLGALRGFDADLGGTGWWIEVECEVRFGPLLFDPDLAGWRVERVPELPPDNPLTIVPDWACEVLSPTTARDDRVLKLPSYASSGVPWVWLVDPILHTIEVFETDPKGKPTLVLTAKENDARVLPPFDEVIDVSGWWLPEPAKPAATVAPLKRTTSKRRARR